MAQRSEDPGPGEQLVGRRLRERAGREGTENKSSGESGIGEVSRGRLGTVLYKHMHNEGSSTVTIPEHCSSPLQQSTAEVGGTVLYPVCHQTSVGLSPSAVELQRVKISTLRYVSPRYI